MSAVAGAGAGIGTGAGAGWLRLRLRSRPAARMRLRLRCLAASGSKRARIVRGSLGAGPGLALTFPWLPRLSACPLAGACPPYALARDLALACACRRHTIPPTPFLFSDLPISPVSNPGSNQLPSHPPTHQLPCLARLSPRSFGAIPCGIQRAELSVHCDSLPPGDPQTALLQPPSSNLTSPSPTSPPKHPRHVRRESPRATRPTTCMYADAASLLQLLRTLPRAPITPDCSAFAVPEPRMSISARTTTSLQQTSMTVRMLLVTAAEREHDGLLDTCGMTFGHAIVTCEWTRLQQHRSTTLSSGATRCSSPPSSSVPLPSPSASTRSPLSSGTSTTRE